MRLQEKEETMKTFLPILGALLAVGTAATVACTVSATSLMSSCTVVSQ